MHLVNMASYVVKMPSADFFLPEEKKIELKTIKPLVT